MGETKLVGGYLPPDEILIWGLDTFPDGLDASDLEDERVALPIDPQMVDSILDQGVIDPVLVRVVRFGHDRTRYYVAEDGRQRVKAARAANKRRPKGDTHAILVPYVVKELDALGVIIANEWRTDDDPLTKARKVRRLQQRGVPMASIQRAFRGCSAGTLKNWLALLGCVPEVQQALQAGEIPWTVGYELGRRTPDEQRALLASGAVLTGEDGRENARTAGDDGEDGEDGPIRKRGPRPPKGPKVQANRLSLREIKRLHSAFTCDDDAPDQVRLVGAVLTFVLTGDSTDLDGWDVVSEWREEQGA